MSVEEKIRRAEEIYQRRKQGEVRQVAKVSVNDKKDIKLLKKMIIQILICIVIYLCVYVIQNNRYIFSENFINRINEILSYDTNFIELYEGIKNQIINFGNQQNNQREEQNQETESDNQENNQENNQNEEQNQETESNNQENNQDANNQDLQQQENTENSADVTNQNSDLLTQSQIDIQNIKNTTTFIKPIEGTITSRYGQTDAERSSVPKEHTGTDIAANLGTKIKSATSGEVVLVSEQEEGYGKYLKIQIGEVSIIYAHCNNIYVSQGDKVEQGQEIAEVGTTGNSTGPHLHFEVRISERTVDPQAILEI